MKKIFSVLLLSVTLTACNKQKSIHAVVKDYGPIELDGCGWVIDMNGEIYAPINLDSEYKIHDLPIVIDFKTLNSMGGCGFQIDAYEEIEIMKIH